MYLSNLSIRDPTQSQTQTTNLQFAPVEVILGEADPQSDSRHEQLLPCVDHLVEDVVVLRHHSLVHLHLACIIELEENKLFVLPARRALRRGWKAQNCS